MNYWLFCFFLLSQIQYVEQAISWQEGIFSPSILSLRVWSFTFLPLYRSLHGFIFSPYASTNIETLRGQGLVDILGAVFSFRIIYQLIGILFGFEVFLWGFPFWCVCLLSWLLENIYYFLAISATHILCYMCRCL